MSNKPKIINFKKYIRKSGRLIPITFDKNFPMPVKRIFFIYGKKKFIRGDHAHKRCDQFFYPVFGKFEITLKFDNKKKKIQLDNQNSKGLYVPAVTWCNIKFLKKDSIILVLASHKYFYSDYIENYESFIKYEKKKQKSKK